MSELSRSPEVLLVHGAWHGSWAFDLLTPLLTDAGWTVRTVDLASSGSASVDVHDDAQVVRESLASNPGPTLVVGHSYGGVVATEGAAGAPNLEGLVYLCAAMPEIGQSVWTDYHDSGQVPDWIKVDEVAGLVRALDAERVFYHDCPADLASRSAALLRPQSLKTFMTPVNAAAWHDAPSAYLVCDEDQCTPPAAQEAYAAHATYVEHIATGHSPFMSRPEAVAGFIQSASAAFR
jgi:pimeloyl-ACP methyl ester carboxylesterase